ncbi:MAG TPA: hypothetical protein PLU22_25080 [Polyangiaceae bacterium]|nr:hypothetical protein [Polyangiaceae bacterium]
MKARPSIEKRRREAARHERQADKAERRAERKKAKGDRAAAVASGEDPDLAGIVPGPQPVSADDEQDDEG